MPKTDEIRGKLSKKYSKCHMLIWQPTTRKGNNANNAEVIDVCAII